MAAMLKRGWPELYHPRRKDISILPTEAQESRLQTMKHYNQPPQPKPHNIPEAQMPRINTVPIQNPFIPMPIFNQPYLPPGTQIPSVYSRPTTILKHPLPTGIAM